MVALAGLLSAAGAEIGFARQASGRYQHVAHLADVLVAGCNWLGRTSSTSAGEGACRVAGVCLANPDTPQCTKLCICGTSTPPTPQLQASPAPAICEVTEASASTASSEWCDLNCLAKPATDSCKATCKCPPAPKKADSPSAANATATEPEPKAHPQSAVALLAAQAPLVSTQSWLQHFLFLSQFEQVRLM